MKTNRKLFILILLAGLFLSGCQKYMDQKVYTSLTTDNFFKTEKDFLSSLVSLYSSFGCTWGMMYNPDQSSEYPLTFTTTDEVVTNWVDFARDFAWGPATFDDLTAYNRLPMVAQATDIIDKISKSKEPESIKNRYVAEAKVIRAFYMYTLYDNFGPLNPRLDPKTLADTTIIPRMTKDDYLNFMIQDLNDALASPDLQETTNDDWDMWGRFSKGVARMLKLRIYMADKQWVNAEAAAKDIVNMNYYALEPDYANIFINKANKEIIWASHADDAFMAWLPQFFFPGGYAVGYAGKKPIVRSAGWYAYAMPWKFFRKFSSNDLRRNTIIYEYTDVDGNKIDSTSAAWMGAIPLKYTGITGEGPNYPIDFVVFRYAEVLLSLAEAINEERGPTEAYQFVNLVRERAGVAAYSGLTQTQLRDSLLDERGRELYMEGVRRMDLIRNGSFIDNALARGKTNAKPYQVLFPIAQKVIVQGRGIIKQNPGY